jgi:hypothetical protein
MVAIAMRTRFDQFGKQLLRRALEGRGVVETDAEVSVETRRSDVWFTPGSDSGEDVGYLGLLDRMTRSASTVELFHATPCGDELAGCVIKHGDFRHQLSLRKARPQVPMQWVISSGRPNSGIEGLWLRPMASWPPGIYEGPPLLWTRLVVASELPAERDTLLVRLLGADGVLKQAIKELEALGADDQRSMLARPILIRLRLEIPADPADQTSDEQDFLMATQDILEVYDRKLIETGVKRTLVSFYEARFGAMPEDLRVAIDEMHDESTLTSWTALMATCTADEVATVIRAVRRR